MMKAGMPDCLGARASVVVMIVMTVLQAPVVAMAVGRMHDMWSVPFGLFSVAEQNGRSRSDALQRHHRECE